MTKAIRLLLISALAVSACVTINVYFPEAAAEEAADRIIDEVRSDDDNGYSSGLLDIGNGLRNMAASIASVLIAPAHAQNANFDASSPATRTLEASLKKRFGQLRPYYASGAIGLTADGLIDFRDRNLIPLSERNRVRQLVNDQNADWQALYAEIARINGHPEWTDNIRKVFADRWIVKAQAGWYYRDAGGQWKQK